jgi:hypothetical protein
MSNPKTIQLLSDNQTFNINNIYEIWVKEFDVK